MPVKAYLWTLCSVYVENLQRKRKCPEPLRDTSLMILFLSDHFTVSVTMLEYDFLPLPSVTMHRNW